MVSIVNTPNKNRRIKDRDLVMRFDNSSGADYFAGSGAQAGEWAGRFKQGLRLWVLWPK